MLDSNKDNLKLEAMKRIIGVYCLLKGLINSLILAHIWMNKKLLNSGIAVYTRQNSWNKFIEFQNYDTSFNVQLDDCKE